MTSDWSGPEGIQTGESLQVVETANGGPFELQGFGWDYGGYVTDWKGGKIASPVQSCDPLMRFASDSADPSIVGEGHASPACPRCRPRAPRWSASLWAGTSRRRDRRDRSRELA